MANRISSKGFMLSQEKFLMESYILWRYCKALGTARSARMVGWAMNASHIDDVPARVGEQKRITYRKIPF
jgi:hypothetical protein